MPSAGEDIPEEDEDSSSSSHATAAAIFAAKKTSVILAADRERGDDYLFYNCRGEDIFSHLNQSGVGNLSRVYQSGEGTPWGQPVQWGYSLRSTNQVRVLSGVNHFPGLSSQVRVLSLGLTNQRGGGYLLPPRDSTNQDSVLSQFYKSGGFTLSGPVLRIRGPVPF